MMTSQTHPCDPSASTASGMWNACLPARGGISLKPEHFRQLLADKPDTGFLEIHAENYLCAGGPFHQALTACVNAIPCPFTGWGCPSVENNR